MLWDPPENEEELIAPYEANKEAWANDHAYGFTIEEMETKVFVGKISIRSQGDSVWDFGFWTHPKKQNQGYMTEAVSALMRFGFEALGASKIIACHAVWNQASEVVLKKCGMVFEAHLPEGFKKRGQWVPENRLAISREEWEAKQTTNPTATT